MEENIDKNIAENLTALRKARNLKQTELAEEIGYSDKTVSRWENGTSSPDVKTLCMLAEFYKVSIDDLTKKNAVIKSYTESIKDEKYRLLNNILMTCLSVFTVWLIAVIIYVGYQIVKQHSFWQIFIWAIPASSIIATRQCKRYNDKPIVETILYSVTAWGLASSVFLQLINYNLWQLFFIPIPIEFIIVIYTLVLKPNKRKMNNIKN